jgi:hypothetical protein
VKRAEDSSTYPLRLYGTTTFEGVIPSGKCALTEVRAGKNHVQTMSFACNLKKSDFAKMRVIRRMVDKRQTKQVSETFGANWAMGRPLPITIFIPAL